MFRGRGERGSGVARPSSSDQAAPEGWEVAREEFLLLVAADPWARHDAGFTRSFEDQTAWLAVNTSKTAVSELMRIA